MGKPKRRRRSPAALAKRAARPQARRHRERQAEPWHRDPGRDILTGLDWLKDQQTAFEKRQGDLLDKRRSASK
jgi:hypothetical protein